LTSSGLTGRCLAARLLCRTRRKRRRIARRSDILITHGSSGGWGRASGLRVFSATLLPSELHRKKSETPAGVDPASRSGCSRPPEPSGPTSSRNKSRRWDSNPLRPRYEGGARPVEHRRPFRAASAGVEPTRPEFRAPIPSRGPGQMKIQSQRRDSNPHAPLYRRGARPVELHWRCRTRADSRLQSGSATVTGSHAATTPYPPSQSVLDLLGPIVEVAAHLESVDLQLVVAEQRGQGQHDVILDALPQGDLPRLRDLPRHRNECLPLWGEQGLERLEQLLPGVPGQHVRHMVAHDGVEQPVRARLPVLGVVRLPAEVVGVEAEAAPVIQDAAPEQPVLVQEAGGLADRPASDRTAQLLDEPEAALAFDLRHTLLAQGIQETALASCSG